MATTIVTKNGSGAPAVGDLVQGELAVDLTNKTLYSKDSSGNVFKVGDTGGGSPGTFTDLVATDSFTSPGIDDTNNPSGVAITIDADANVGIGVTVPQKALAVHGGILAATGTGASTSGITIDSTASSGYAATITHTDSGMEFDNNASNRDYLFGLSGGSVGINEPSPSSTLDVNGTFRVTSGTARYVVDPSPAVSGYEALVSMTDIGLEHTLNSSSRGFIWANGQGEHMRITAAGNVGINETDPDEKLVVNTGSTGISKFITAYSFQQRNAAIEIASTAPNAGNGSGYIAQGLAGGGIGLYQGGTYYGGGNYKLYGNATSISAVQLEQGSIRFQASDGYTTDGSPGNTERMRITPEGNVAIGASVAGDNRLYVKQPAGAGNFKAGLSVLADNSTYNDQAGLVRISASGAGNCNLLVGVSNSGASAFSIGQNGDTKIAGNLEVNGDSFVHDTPNGRITLDRDVGINRFMSSTTGFGSYQRLETRAADFTWRLGTAQPAMTLDTSGNVLVGRTSTSSAATDYGTQLYSTGIVYQYADATGPSDIHRWYNGSGTLVATINGDGEGYFAGGATYSGTLKADEIIQDGAPVVDSLQIIRAFMKLRAATADPDSTVEELREKLKIAVDDIIDQFQDQIDNMPTPETPSTLPAPERPKKKD